jgi:hypothetical protein
MSESEALSAMDSANLAAVIAASDYMRNNAAASEEEAAENAQAVGERYFEENRPDSKDLDIDYTLIVSRNDNNWIANGQFSGTFKNKFAGLLGLDDWQISSQATSLYNKPFIPVLDIAMCFDATGSMMNTLNAVKANALSFYDDLIKELERNSAGSFVQIRVRLIYFRDFAVDKVPLRTSNPFILPSENAKFKEFVDPEKATGRGDTPESGLECVNEAMDTAWV